MDRAYSENRTYREEEVTGRVLKSQVGRSGLGFLSAPMPELCSGKWVPMDCTEVPGPISPLVCTKGSQTKGLEDTAVSSVLPSYISLDLSRVPS